MNTWQKYELKQYDEKERRKNDKKHGADLFLKPKTHSFSTMFLRNNNFLFKKDFRLQPPTISQHVLTY